MKKSVLVTGGVRNTGLGIAEKFLQEGWTVFLTSRSAADAEKKAAELAEKYGQECYGLGYDPLNAKQESEALFEKIAQKGYVLDSLVCNAADLGRWQNPLNVDLDAWENVLLTNVMGYFVPARIAAREMIAAGKAKTGTIVFIGSINCRDALPERSAYCASKGAIRSMTKALALDFAPYGIRVNCVMPGPIWTTRYDEMDPQEAARREKLIPLGKASTAAQIAGGVYFFATEASGNATGSGLVMDGGMDSMVAGGY